LLDRALRSASDTRFLLVSERARRDAAGVFVSAFGSVMPIIVTDANSFEAAGRDVYDSFGASGHADARPFVFGSDVYAEASAVDELQAALAQVEAIPVAVGSGTINDLTKLAAHRLGRPYMVVATAASMDGYTAYGASITANGSKQTFDCPAPRAVLADLEIIAAAPAVLNAAGYADLLAKIAAGADWILADAAGVEAIDDAVWNTVQGSLRLWVSSPGGIARGESTSLRRLIDGLMMSGFAMQAARSSRPASGAEHQFSHLWDMQHHTFEGFAPSHGFKVGIGTLASIALYENLLSMDWNQLDVAAAAGRYPALGALKVEIAELFGNGELAQKAIEETAAKYPRHGELRQQLAQAKEAWPSLRSRLTKQLIPFHEAQDMLGEAGCPHLPEQIGISRERLRLSYRQARYIRRRFTVLDLADRIGATDAVLEKMFGPSGHWSGS
jgi:glycerol-1-phosphate dehydrogenase [NAD(P)+]